MNLRQLLNRPEKPKPKSQLLLAYSKNNSKAGYCIVLMDTDKPHKLINSTYKINNEKIYQCYSHIWNGHHGCRNEINNTFHGYIKTLSQKLHGNI